jgi:hypothetical protein
MKTYLLMIYQWTMVSHCYVKGDHNAAHMIERKLWFKAIDLYHFTADYRIY